VTGNPGQRSISRPPARSQHLPADSPAPNYMRWRTSFAPSARGSQTAPTRQGGVTATSHGNRVHRAMSGPSEKAPAMSREPAKPSPAPEYLSQPRCGLLLNHSGSCQRPAVPRKVGLGRPWRVPHLRRDVGPLEKVTGDEHGLRACAPRHQYVGSDSTSTPGVAPAKVDPYTPWRGTGLLPARLWAAVSWSPATNPGTCRLSPATNYIGSQQFEGFCGGPSHSPEPAKVGPQPHQQSSGGLRHHYRPLVAKVTAMSQGTLQSR